MVEAAPERWYRERLEPCQARGENLVPPQSVSTGETICRHPVTRRSRRLLESSAQGHLVMSQSLNNGSGRRSCLIPPALVLIVEPRRVKVVAMRSETVANLWGCGRGVNCNVKCIQIEVQRR